MKKTHFILIITVAIVASFQASMAQGTFEMGTGSLLNFQFISSQKKGFADSLRDLSKPHMSFQAGIRANFDFKKNWGCQVGIGYARYNSRFERVGLRFHDSIHPEVGRIEDLSEAATKTAIYRYNFDYIDIPINFTYKLIVRKGAAYYTPYIIMGFNNAILLNHQLRIDTKGFTVNGENLHKVDDSGWTPAQYNLLINLGARFEIKLDKNTDVVLQPEFKLPLLKSTLNDPTIRYGAVGIWLGIARNI